MLLPYGGGASMLLPYGGRGHNNSQKVYQLMTQFYSDVTHDTESLKLHKI